jgi:hypothetical protein
VKAQLENLLIPTPFLNQEFEQNNGAKTKPIQYESQQRLVSLATFNWANEISWIFSIHNA